MRIIAFVKGLNHVCCRYRLAAYRPFLERDGHQLELRTWPRDWWSRLWLRRQIGRSDMIVLQRRLPGARQLAVLRDAAEFLIYDFDDAVFMRDSFTPGGPHCAGRAEGFARTIRAAHAVIAGNSFLQEQAALWTDPARIHVMPTLLDPSRYVLAEHTRRHNVQLVWIGSASTLRGLNCIKPQLEQWGRCRPDLYLKIICDRFLHLEHLRVLGTRWSETSEARELADADIGISWLPNDLWSQGKCGLKVLQYMAAGLPVIASPVGFQKSLVRHGETGYLAETPEEWQTAIERLAGDPELRRTMGRAGRALVEANYHIGLGARRWTSLLDRLQSAVSTS